MSGKLLITGGAGFIGSHCVIEALARGYDVFNLDALTYAADLKNLSVIESDPRYRFIKGDIRDRQAMATLFEHEKFDFVMHLAAESHVDRSVKDPGIFVETNVQGTENLLAAALASGVRRFVHVSTDEVYGELQAGEPAFTEETPLKPNSPYSASKAGSDLLTRAYHKTFGLPAVITRCSNNYGPHQDGSKLIPVIIKNTLAGKKIPIYARGENIRDWLYVKDHVGALFCVLQNGRAGEVYNVGGNNEVKNIDIAKAILKILKKPETLIEFVADRPGHDFRYAIDSSKIRKELGWEPNRDFEKLLAETVRWYNGP